MNTSEDFWKDKCFLIHLVVHYPNNQENLDHQTDISGLHNLELHTKTQKHL